MASIFDRFAHIEISPSLKGGEKARLDALFPGKRYAAICDARTYDALGHRFKNLADILTLEDPVASVSAAERIRDRAQAADALIAVGSGTINDLVKYASFLDGKPYAVFPTAPSMNGYLSATASLIAEDIKKTLPAHAPRGIFCDMEVIRAAPLRMIRAGFGDLICRPTAQCDWLLSHLLTGTPYHDEIYKIYAPYEQALYREAEGIGKSDPKAVAILMEALLVSGMGMMMAGGSYPFSQGEHAIAHCAESLGCPPSLHGEQIAVTTLMMAEIQGRILSGGAFSNEIATRIRPHFLPTSYLRPILEQAGCPTQASDIGWDETLTEHALKAAPFLRERMSFLNVPPSPA